MNFFSCFSGIEAASVAFDPLGFECVGFSEIDPFCCELLKTRFPTVRNYGDIEQYKQWDIEPGSIRFLCGGSPCQSYSTSGNRKGLEDPRGNLALVYFGFLERLRPRWLLLENVPGILSSNGGRDFGTLLGKLAKLGYGFAYCILDAQNFGVPQRRRRVFLVGHSGGDWRRPAAVLFNRESVFGNLEAGEIQGEGTSAGTSGSTRKRDVVGALTASPKNHAGSYTGQDAYQNKLIPVRTPNHWAAENKPHPALTQSSSSGLPGYSNQELFSQRGEGLVGANRFYNENPCKGTVKSEKVSQTLLARAGTGGGNLPIVIPIHNQATRHQGNDGRGKGNGLGVGNAGDPSPTITATDNHSVALGSSVRRLTPRECERLQGFPDDWTKIAYRGRTADKCADAPRYHALGNSWAVPVVRWIGERIKEVDAWT